MLCFSHTKRKGMEVPHTFVRTVKAQDLRFGPVDSVLRDIKSKNSPTWVIFTFAVGCCRCYLLAVAAPCGF